MKIHIQMMKYNKSGITASWHDDEDEKISQIWYYVDLSTLGGTFVIGVLSPERSLDLKRRGWLSARPAP